MSKTIQATVTSNSKSFHPLQRIEPSFSDNYRLNETGAETPRQTGQQNRETAHEEIIAQQPRGGKTMSTEKSGEVETPMRVRGGCIPCPGGGTCWIIPIPCCF